MSSYDHQTSAEVAREAESERADLAHTLDQLRENLQSRNVVNEVMSAARINSAEVSDRIGQIARMNPIATAIIGIGVAMLFGASRMPRHAADPTVRRWAGSERFPVDAGPSGLRADRTLHDGSMSGSRQTSGVAMRNLPMLKQPQSALAKLIEEQPLVLAALGVAVGAAVGVAIPSTDLESQFLGDASQSVRTNAGAAARAQVAQLRTTASQTFEQMKATAAEHGATAENLSGLIHDLGDNVRDASQAVGSQAGAPTRA